MLAVLGGGAAAVARDPALAGHARRIVDTLWQRVREAVAPPALVARPQPARVVPVTAVPARKQDLELFLDGLGAVDAFNTVTVRARVDGALVKVAFREGQAVAEGPTASWLSAINRPSDWVLIS